MASAIKTSASDIGQPAASLLAKNVAKTGRVLAAWAAFHQL